MDSPVLLIEPLIKQKNLNMLLSLYDSNLEIRRTLNRKDIVDQLITAFEIKFQYTYDSTGNEVENDIYDTELERSDIVGFLDIARIINDRKKRDEIYRFAEKSFDKDDLERAIEFRSDLAENSSYEAFLQIQKIDLSAYGSGQLRDIAGLMNLIEDGLVNMVDKKYMCRMQVSGLAFFGGQITVLIER